MEITFTCPVCGEVTLIDDTFIGQSGECRACGEVVTVPPVVARGEQAMGVVAAPPAKGTWFYLKYGAAAAIVLLVVTLCLLPNARYATPASRRIQSAQKLKQIALAMHNYHDVYGHFPRPYWVLPSGERTLSWRVAILPFMESSDVAEQYRADEPWDSPANLEVGKRLISTYHNPWRHRKSSETLYLVVTGPGTLFEEGKEYSFKDCTDGSANTILAVEVKDSGVAWARPADLDIRTMILKINSGAFGIRSDSAKGANVAMADGSVRFLPNETLESTLRAMLTRAGGEMVPEE